ncbi:hypothetical protein [Klebsiella phage phiKp_21]|uniref:Scaffolding protein n=2 Tax=Alcyoneusvirus TaxID=2560086 RepID=A0A0A8J969_BPK64|nr:hypothetical protein F403_gp442 [Klebsiella phage vB_KleM_RaK2]YP_010843007.1 coil containing protein [Klebsiella phage K64-1]QOE32503.1 scaffolding protein [Klebsiella phage Muenster]UYL05527.1 hypothetical protein DIDNDMLP_00542 [Klebsiella phage KP13-7]BEH88393.1 hypothetical protein [Klebsiella phage phiKp_21]AFA44366.1 hypothetical protein RaK2_00093 [Klebsiella phage vB_KleM_RaK2]BAQ02803.1 hypothetical protein [Klebsiella phage K64-1]
MTKLEKLLKESSLSDEAKQLIQEAWNEEKNNLAAEMRQEMKERYKQDLAELTEGLDQMMSTVIAEEMNAVYDEKRKLVEDRVTLRKTLSNFSGFANSVLAEEVKQMRNERKLIKESMNKFVNFSNNILAEELKEFHVEKRQLVESRVKLLAEGSKKINEARDNFIKRTSESAAKYITETTQKHLSALKQDIAEAKQNTFGRKLYEAFSNEFYSQQFNENVLLRSLNESLKTKEDEIVQVKQALSESTKAVKEVQHKLRVMEDTQARNAIISELTKPLNVQQKQIMESLLATSPTEKLKDDFNKYHKSVLNGTKVTESVKDVQPKKKTLSEGSVVTGNRQQAKVIVENSEIDEDDMKYLEELSILSGIIKK